MRYEQMVAEWCEETINAFSAISGAAGVVPFDAGTRKKESGSSD